jgi:hypothetical protein
MPFFDQATGNSWNVTLTGDYGKDCETGTAYAIEFLRSCDGTVGWSSLLSPIIAGMIAAAARSGRMAGQGQTASSSGL